MVEGEGGGEEGLCLPGKLRSQHGVFQIVRGQLYLELATFDFIGDVLVIDIVILDIDS